MYPMGIEREHLFPPSCHILRMNQNVRLHPIYQEVLGLHSYYELRYDMPTMQFHLSLYLSLMI